MAVDAGTRKLIDLARRGARWTRRARVGTIRNGRNRAEEGAAEAADPADEAEAAHEERDEATEAAPTPPEDEPAQREGEPTRTRSAVGLAMVVGIVAVLALAGLSGWLGYRAYQSREDQAQRNLFLQVARQGAVNLTTISHTEPEADVQRILDSSTGSFYDEFQERSQAFIEVVKQAQSKSGGTVTEAGLESEEGDRAEALVAVTVKTSNAGAAEQQPRMWRMRISVQKVGDGAKVSNVQFVP